MTTLLAIVLFEVLVIVTVALYVDCRRPTPPFWASDFVVYVSVGPALVGILAAAVALVVDAANDWSTKGIGVSDLPWVVASVAVTAVLIVLLKPRKRLARYASMQPVPSPREYRVAGPARLGTDQGVGPQLPKVA